MQPIGSCLAFDKEFAEEVGKKYADDLREAFRKGREQEKEDYKWENRLLPRENAKELLAYQMQCLGNRPDSAALFITFVIQWMAISEKQDLITCFPQADS